MTAHPSPALAVLLLLAGPALRDSLAAPPTDRLTLVIQTAPLRTLLRASGALGGSEPLRPAVNGVGIDGVDFDRPLIASLAVAERPAESGGVLAVPITGEKEFVELLGRVGVQTRPLKGRPGVHTLEIPGGGFLLPCVLRIAGTWAYVGLNGATVGDAGCPIPAGDLFDAREAAHVAIRFFPGRLNERTESVRKDGTSVVLRVTFGPGR